MGGWKSFLHKTKFRTKNVIIGWKKRIVRIKFYYFFHVSDQNVPVESLEGAKIEKKDVSKEAKESLISVQCRGLRKTVKAKLELDSRKMDMASAPLLGRTTTVEDNKTQVNLEKGVSSHQVSQNYKRKYFRRTNIQFLTFSTVHENIFLLFQKCKLYVSGHSQPL